MRLSDLQGRCVVMWGAAREATAVINALTRFNIEVDLSVVDDLDGKSHLGEHSILRDSAMTDALDNADVIIRSPAISRYRKDVIALRDRGIEFTTATRLWFAEGLTNVIGITGTKGKSTTASLVARLLEATGLTVELAGNIGRSPLELLGTSQPDWWVVELSSFQTSDLEQSPAIGVLTSLSPEHLDWHLDEATYRQDKLNLFAHDANATVVVNGADPGARAVISEIAANIVTANEAPSGRVADGFFQVGSVPVASTNAFQLLGKHNRELASVALSVCEVAGVDISQHVDAIAHALSTFEPLSHRLKTVANIDGVIYVDDSLSTTPAATIAALSSFDGHSVSVLVGGFDRGLSYDELARYVKSTHGRVNVVALPESGERIIQALNDAGCATSTIFEAASIEDAVVVAADNSSDGGVVLLSPGAPSFGAYKNYAERGNAFSAAAHALSSAT